MDAGITLEHPFSVEPMGWLKAIGKLGDHSNLPASQEKSAVDEYSRQNSLFQDRSPATIRKTVNLFRARILLRLSRGLRADDIEKEYRLYQLMLLRESGYDRSVRLCIDEILADEISDVVQTAIQLVELAENAGST